MSATPSPPPRLRAEARLAAAALADRGALAQLALRADGAAIAQREKLGPALARAAVRAGLDSPATVAWRAELRAGAATRLWLNAAAAELVEVLGQSGIPFLPIKGWDLGRRIYPAAEERPTSDLDLLLPAARLEEAVAALAGRQFRSLQQGRYAALYLRQEGYAAALRAPAGQLVELHFRLWGSAPAGLDAAILAAAAADPGLGTAALAARLEHAYLLAAFHLFLDPPPRPAGAFRDLALLAEQRLDAEFLLAECRRFGLALPVALASATAAALYGVAGCAELAAVLREELRWPERQLGWSAEVGSGPLFLARLLAGRPSRHGWRILWRRLWPHRGVVEAATAAERPWLLRRLWYQWKLVRGQLRPGEKR